MHMSVVLLTALGVGGATMIGGLIGFIFKKLTHWLNDLILAFAAGIMLCAATLGLIMPSIEYGSGKAAIFITVAGVFLGAVGVYQKIIDFAGAGASVPLTGFGSLLAKGVKESVTKDGFLGIFTGGFQAAAGGIGAAVFFGWLASLIFTRV